jgi:hypothetical protein
MLVSASVLLFLSDFAAIAFHIGNEIEVLIGALQQQQQQFCFLTSCFSNTPANPFSVQ